MPEIDYILPDLVTMKKSQWSPRFEKLMRERLIQGAFRYGLLNTIRKVQYDIPSSIRARLLRYEKDGNLEHLVDIANLAMVEFMTGDHPKKHFRSSSENFHTKEKY